MIARHFSLPGVLDFVATVLFVLSTVLVSQCHSYFCNRIIFGYYTPYIRTIYALVILLRSWMMCFIAALIVT